MHVPGMHRNQLSMMQHLVLKREQTIGFVDAIGNFVLFLWEHHVDMNKEANLGFFKKMSYNDKMKEI